MYKEFRNLQLPEIDKEILKFWADNRIFEKSIDQRDPENSFVFYEGPPSANGKPGIHHVISRTIKDLFCRYHSMKGQRVERKGGWDTHGLPIELSVEKELGITKEDIGTKITVEEYNRKCRETVMRYKDLWDDLTVKMGYWVDLDHPYITYENEYIESVWYLLRRLYDKGLLYKGYTIQPYSPAAGTGLSTHELNQPGTYKEVSDTTVTAMFKVVRNSDSEFLFQNPFSNSPVISPYPGFLSNEQIDDLYILAWTTTPWTLPSNTALTVGPKIEYFVVNTSNPYTRKPVTIIIAKDRLTSIFKDAELKVGAKGNSIHATNKQSVEYTILRSITGKQLEGIRYEQLLPGPKPADGDAFRVLTGDFVTTEDGTGVVHTAPSFGADDMRVARANGIGSLTLVDKTGKFTAEAGEFAGRYVKDYTDDPYYQSVDVDIAVKLKLEGKAFNVAKYVHNYPHCWRTDKPVLYYPLDSWFIRASSVKERMFELNQTINWKPAATGEGRFGKWLENLQDWNLSRSRFWGIPLPVWRTEDGSAEKCIGSVEELKKEIEAANAKLGLNQTAPPDLHRPYIDDVVLASDSGERMTRETDLIDVWFDSGSMPYAQWHYPFENQEKFRQNYPADFIAEGVDQTRGWFYTLHAIAVMAFDSVSFKNVVSNGLVLDKNGQKMSKRLGNAVDPFDTLATFGADATRWYMISNSDPWENLKFDQEGLEEVSRKFFRKLFDLYSFFSLYANIDGFAYREAPVPLADRPEIDRWIISVLNTLVKEVDADYADYEPTKATRKVMAFVDEHLSNWYVRLNRRRFWKGEYTADKTAAYQTLYDCLLTVSKLMAPVAPFFAEWLYSNLNGATGRETSESIHLADFPAADAAAIDLALEQRMDYAQRISSLVLSLRKKEKIRVRQPLHKILLPVLDGEFQHQVEAVKDLILAEVNVKELEYITDASGVIKKRAKANFKTLGRRLGKHMKAAADAIAGWSDAQISELEKTGAFPLTIDGETYDLTPEDVDISTEDIPGWLVAGEGGLTVALDITITPELEAEGIARDLVNRIQNLRKDQNFEVTDKIRILLEQHEAVTAAVAQFSDYIQAETLAVSLELSANPGNGAKIELSEGVELGILVEVV